MAPLHRTGRARPQLTTRGLLAAAWILVAGQLGSCQSTPKAAAPPPIPETPATGEPAAEARIGLRPLSTEAPAGWRDELPGARLFVPRTFSVGTSGEDAAAAPQSVPLRVHFQGGPSVAERHFDRSGACGVLIASTLAGLSSSFRKPYEDPAAFRYLLEEGEASLGEHLGLPVRFDPVTVTFFSAGYGAVREILKSPAHFDRIDCLVSADSIYANVVAQAVRAPAIEQMVDFAQFAQAAARSEKTFILVHSSYATEYASTRECADLLLASVAGQREPAGWPTEDGTWIDGECHIGRFHMLTSDLTTPEIHVECLHMIPELLLRYGLIDTGQ